MNDRFEIFMRWCFGIIFFCMTALIVLITAAVFYYAIKGGL